MNTVFSGTAHDLSKLFETPGYRLFLFTKGGENEYRVNLGMNRIMTVRYAALLLIPENGGKLRMEILKATEEKQSVSVAGELKRLGIKYKVIADYDKKLKWQFHPAWKNQAVRPCIADDRCFFVFFPAERPFSSFSDSSPVRLRTGAAGFICAAVTTLSRQTERKTRKQADLSCANCTANRAHSTPCGRDPSST